MSRPKRITSKSKIEDRIRQYQEEQLNIIEELTMATKQDHVRQLTEDINYYSYQIQKLERYVTTKPDPEQIETLLIILEKSDEKYDDYMLDRMITKQAYQDHTLDEAQYYQELTNLKIRYGYERY